MSETYISIDHLSKKYDKDFVLKDVNAVLHKGENLGFLGPSGAGKTTTIKILTGQLMPTSGTAEVLVIDCRRIDERIYEQIGIVTDSSGVYERMTVFLTTHNMEEATKLCDHVALLNEGVIVEYGTPEEICLKYNRIRKYRVQLTDGTKHVLLQSPETAGHISSWMNEDKIETLHTCEPTLETVFLEVTGRELQ